jgi:hypothetical protein
MSQLRRHRNNYGEEGQEVDSLPAFFEPRAVTCRRQLCGQGEGCGKSARVETNPIPSGTSCENWAKLINLSLASFQSR